MRVVGLALRGMAESDLALGWIGPPESGHGCDWLNAMP
jgi:hypothetical protein